MGPHLVVSVLGEAVGVEGREGWREGTVKEKMENETEEENGTYWNMWEENDKLIM